MITHQIAVSNGYKPSCSCLFRNPIESRRGGTPDPRRAMNNIPAKPDPAIVEAVAKRDKVSPSTVIWRFHAYGSYDKPRTRRPYYGEMLLDEEIAALTGVSTSAIRQRRSAGVVEKDSDHIGIPVGEIVAAGLKPTEVWKALRETFERMKSDSKL